MKSVAIDPIFDEDGHPTGEAVLIDHRSLERVVVKLTSVQKWPGQGPSMFGIPETDIIEYQEAQAAGKSDSAPVTSDPTDTKPPADETKPPTDESGSSVVSTGSAGGDTPPNPPTSEPGAGSAAGGNPGEAQ